jgi:hypothetical protein
MRRMVIPTVLASLACALTAMPAAAQDVAHPAHIHEGLCPTPGAIVAPLGDVSPDLFVDGAPGVGSLPVGAQPARPLAASITTVGIPLATIVGSDHSIVVHASAADMGTYLVCGVVGGRTMGDRDLPIALAPVGDSGFSGVAVLSDAGSDTTRVAVYLIGSDAAAGGPAASPSPSASIALVPVAVELGQRIQFAGYDIAIEEARFDPVLGTLAIDGLFGNTGTGPANLTSIQLRAQPSVTWGTTSIPLRFATGGPVPAGTTSHFTLQAAGQLPDGFTLDGSTLAFGTADQHQATLPLQGGAPGSFVATQRFRVPKAARSLRIKGAMRVMITSARVVPATCTGRPDGVTFDPTGTDEMSLVLSVTIQGLAPNGALLGSFVTVPDGTSAVGGPGTVGIRRGDTLRDITLCYRIPAPAAGRYRWRIESDRRKASSSFQIPAPATP